MYKKNDPSILNSSLVKSIHVCLFFSDRKVKRLFNGIKRNEWIKETKVNLDLQKDKITCRNLYIESTTIKHILYEKYKFRQIELIWSFLQVPSRAQKHPLFSIYLKFKGFQCLITLALWEKSPVYKYFNKYLSSKYSFF